jgi:hypothetical protein
VRSSFFSVSCSDLSNLLISTIFSVCDIRSLLFFLKGLEENLDFSQFFSGGSTLYLQGMILENNSKSIYISLETFKIFSESETQVYPDYFPFMLLQYSLFPTVLVFNSKKIIPKLAEVLEKYEESVEDFLTFLSGNRDLSLSLCFYCWNASHDSCADILGYENWVCSCGKGNPYYSMFCLDCSSGKRPAFNTSICPVCSNLMDFTYCLNCSFLADCFSCDKKIFYSQLVGCPECLTWSNSGFCSGCQEDNSKRKLQCFNCFSKRLENKNSLENLEDVSFKNCLFDFTCAACFKGKMTFDARFCWKCKNGLIDDFCFSCNQLCPHSALICQDCVGSAKVCHQNHVITRYSSTLCKSCKSLIQRFCRICEKKGHNCVEKQCKECGLVFDDGFDQKCLICCYFEEFGDGSEVTEHKCEDFLVCFCCFCCLKTCDCGSRFLTGSAKCPVCLKVVKPSDPRVIKRNSIVQNEWTCKFCGFSNEKSAIFCENCNSNKKWLDKNPKKCLSCGFSHYFEECTNKFRANFCISCKKDVLGSQGMFCLFCKERLKGRMCLNCKVFSVFGRVFCIFCKENHWTCKCGRVNDEDETICECGLNYIKE